MLHGQAALNSPEEPLTESIRPTSGARVWNRNAVNTVKSKEQECTEHHKHADCMVSDWYYKPCTIEGRGGVSAPFT